MAQSDLIWTLIGFILTLLVFSYLFGDNPLFRVAVYLFVGVAAGYVATLVVYQVILPRMVYPLLTASPDERMLVLSMTVVPLALGVMMLGKLSPRFSGLGNFPMAYLVGSGAAIVIGGSVFGTLIGQSRAAISAFDMQAPGAVNQNPAILLLEGSVLLIGTVATLLYFHFSGRARPGEEAVSATAGHRSPAMEWAARAGQAFIAVTFGALFAGVYASAVTALVDRVGFFRDLFVMLQNLAR